MKFFEKIETAQTNEIKAALKERFAKNLNFFRRKDKKLFEALSVRPSMFGLVVDEAGVNVLNLATNSLVYPMDKNGRHAAISVCAEIAKNPLSHTKWRRGFEPNPFYMAISNFAFTSEICRELFGFSSVNGLNPNEIHLPDLSLPFAAIYGLGGGFVLESMAEKYEKIETLFIYEPFNDFFGISAHFVDFEELFSRVKNVFLAVGELPNSAEVRAFLLKNRFLSLYPRLELTMFDTPQIESVKNIVSMEAGALFRGFGSYEDEMIGWRNSQKNISFSNVKYPVLQKPKKKIETPICVVGSGGSLDESIDFLRKNREKMLIFSSGTALRTLLKNSIVPDFQIEIERTDYLGEILREAGARHVDMIVANVSHPNTLAAAGGEKFIFFRDYAAVSYLDTPKFMLANSSPFVGNAALSLALTFSKTVLLCGMDVGYKKDRTIHSKDSIYKENAELPEGSVRVAANFESSEIYSNHLFNLSRTVLEFAAFENKDSRIFNLSDGAKIAGATPCAEISLPNVNRADSVKSIKTVFSDKPSELFGKNGILMIENELDGFKKELFGIFAKEICDKNDFFKIVHSFEEFSHQKELKNDLLFFLFGGSLRHMLFALCVCILHTNVADFKSFYLELIGIFFAGFEKMVSDFKTELAKSKVSGLLGSFKAP